MALDKVKLKELILEKKTLDDEAKKLGEKQMDWNKKFNELVGKPDVGWDDLMLQVLTDD